MERPTAEAVLERMKRFDVIRSQSQGAPEAGEA
jgi:putative ABC transport system ATP-binding protein